MLYPPCPNCGHQLPIGDFFREVGARRLSNFRYSALSSSPGFRQDPNTGEEVPVQFSITCAPCGATSAVDTSEQGKLGVLVLGAGVLLLLGVLVLSMFMDANGVMLCVVVYCGACACVFRVLSVFTSQAIFTVTLTSVPDAERAKETYAERRARSDHDAAVEIARLGPDFQQVEEPVPLEEELADEAVRIDAAHAAAPRSTSERPEYERAEEEELERAKITCVNCGELNQRDFGRCWNCESVL